MDKERVLAKFRSEHLGRTIVQNPSQGRPTEIICEVEPTIDHPDYSVHLAVIDISSSHLHRRSRETYEVLEGSLMLSVEGKPHDLKKGNAFVVEPNSVHFAKGNETLVRIKSEPGWTKEDQVEVKERFEDDYEA
ncbi:MAG TPA: cupin domain-containing protein [Patescibacteria group bacterium]|nr:cupin domain-containing protein [Patescibacteria group bacterium]